MDRVLYNTYIEKSENELYVLKDMNGKILSYFETSYNQELTQDELIRLLKMPYISYQHRVCVLNPDDTICYQIPFEHIPDDGISYDENLQDGQRRSLSIRLINKDGRYTPTVNSQRGYYSMFYDSFVKNNSIKGENRYMANPQYIKDSIWGSIKMSYDIGIKINDTDYVWFKKGVFRVSNINIVDEDSNKEIDISLVDKFSIFEGNTGKLLVSTEIPSGTDCKMIIRDLLNEDYGDGYSFDMLDPIFNEALESTVTSVLIRKEEGDTRASIIQEVATQMNASYYYNECGRLVFDPIQDELRDEVKPLCWIYEPKNMDLISINMSYDLSSAVNMIKVVGDNMGEKVNYALVVNNNSLSPICVGVLGKRMGDIITDANVWSDSMAFDVGRYYLRKNSIKCLKTDIVVKLNPLVEINKLIDVVHDMFQFKHQKFIVSGISWSSNSYEMSISTINVQNLSFLKAGDNGYEY
jgi:hypothetical protein